MNRLTAVLKDAVECRCRPNLDDIDAQNILFAFEDNYQLRAKVAELEAQLAKYQNLEPVAYSVMCDGTHPGNVFGQKQTAESKMQSLNEQWPDHSRKVVPLYALEK